MVTKRSGTVKIFALVIAALMCTFLQGADVIVNIPALPAGKSVKIIFDATVNNPLPAGVTMISAQATVTSDSFATQLSDDPSTLAVLDATLFPVEAAPDLRLTKSANVTGIGAGGNLVYKLAFTNAGNQGATGVVLN